MSGQQSSPIGSGTMADISRGFSPVVVFNSGEARPNSSDRVRSASTRRTSRISSAVSYVSPEPAANNEKIFEKELKQELSTRRSSPPLSFCFIYSFHLALSGIDLLELINEKISKLDHALRSVEAPSDLNKNQALITSEKLRADAVQNGAY